MGFGSRKQQRFRKKRMLPVILFVICLFLFVMTATHGAPIVTNLTKPLTSHILAAAAPQAGGGGSAT